MVTPPWPRGEEEGAGAAHQPGGALGPARGPSLRLEPVPVHIPAQARAPSKAPAERSEHGSPRSAEHTGVCPRPASQGSLRRVTRPSQRQQQPGREPTAWTRPESRGRRGPNTEGIAFCSALSDTQAKLTLRKLTNILRRANSPGHTTLAPCPPRARALSPRGLVWAGLARGRTWWPQRQVEQPPTLPPQGLRVPQDLSTGGSTSRGPTAQADIPSSLRVPGPGASHGRGQLGTRGRVSWAYRGVGLVL